MELRKQEKQVNKQDGKREFVKRAALTASLMLGAAGCIEVNNIPYDPPGQNPDGTTVCLTDCEARTGILREEGNEAGSSELSVGNAVLRFKGLVDEGPAKAASFELEGCGAKAQDSLVPGETTTFTINSESVDVSVESMDYDGAGLRLSVMAVPICAPSGDGGSG